MGGKLDNLSFFVLPFAFTINFKWSGGVQICIFKANLFYDISKMH